MSPYICNKKGHRKGCEACGHGKPHPPYNIAQGKKCDQPDNCFGPELDKAIKVQCIEIKEK
jgi:hypothetical protein